MTSATLKGIDFVLADVPKGAGYLALRVNKVEYRMQKFTTITDHSIMLPPGTYTPIGLGSEIGEEVARGIVEFENKVVRGYKDYVESGKLYSTALESLHSWLRSLGHEPETTFVLQKNK